MERTYDREIARVSKEIVAMGKYPKIKYRKNSLHSDYLDFGRELATYSSMSLLDNNSLI